MKRDAARDDRAAAAGINANAYLTLACSRAGLGSWPEALQSMRGGAILRLAFARRRPAGFMQAFAALLRHECLQLRATGSLDLYLGTPAGLAALDVGHPGELAELTVGAVEPDDTTVALSAPARSAGVRQGKHQRRAARPAPSAS